MKNIFFKIFGVLSIMTFILGCQRMDRPELGTYPKDINSVGGPLKFFVAFDGTTTNPLMNAVDSIRANFPQDNPLSSTDGISGKAIQGANKKFVKYSKPNDWVSTANSFTISFWEKHSNQTQNNLLNNGPEYIYSIPSSNGHWSGAQNFLLFEGNNNGCAIKFVIVDKNMNDPWLTWEGGESVAGLLDNQWHHCVLVYDANTSGLTLYKDGTKISTKAWTAHGSANLDGSTVAGFKIGCGPATNYDTDDWLSSSWKGGIDQFRLYSSALTASEITILYNKKR